jgi:hypothetical protein
LIDAEFLFERAYSARLSLTSSLELIPPVQSDLWPNTLSRRLKANAKLLQESFGVLLTQSRTQQGKYIELKPVTDMTGMSDD